MSMSLSKTMDPFCCLPAEILCYIAEFLKDSTDVLHFGLASPAFMAKVVAYRDPSGFKSSYLFQASYGGIQMPPHFMLDIKAEVSFAQPDKTMFEKAFNLIMSQRRERRLRNGNVAVVVVPDVRRVWNFSKFLCLQEVPGLEVVCTPKWTDDRHNYKVITIVVTHRTDVFLPRPMSAILLSPACAMDVRNVLQLGPIFVAVIWPLEDDIRQNYSSVRSFLSRFDLRDKQQQVTKPVVKLHLPGLCLYLHWFNFSWLDSASANCPRHSGGQTCP